MKKVKYPYFLNTERLIELAKSVDLKTSYNLLDILEFHNVQKFLTNNSYPQEFSDKQVKVAKAQMYQTISLFFKNRTKEEILSDFIFLFDPNNIESLEEIDEKIKDGTLDHDSETQDILHYRDDFIECFEKYDLADRIDEETLEQSLQNLELQISLFLKTDYFIQRYPQVMKKNFILNPSNFELVLNNYTKNNTGNKTKYYIPKNISKDEMYKFCLKYIENESTNGNYLGLIEQGIQGIKELNIDAKLKLKAKRKNEEIEKKLFFNEDGTFIKNGHRQKIVVYTKKIDYENESSDTKAFIDIDWLKDNSEPESLLNYLMYMDDFFTNNWILNLCSFPNFEASVLEIFLGVRSQKHYEISYSFSNKNALVLLSFQVIETFLKKELDTRIEDLIIYFFTKYSKENFKVSWLNLDFAQQDEKMSIQTKNLFTIEEHIRKQWKLLVEEKEIDKDLFELENTPRISDLKSLLDKKYIYVNHKNEDIPQILSLLFSDQSGLGYINESLKEENFVQLILKNRVNKNDLLNFQFQNIQFLVDKDIISVDEDSFLFMTAKQLTRITIFSRLYNFGVIHYYHTLDNPMILELQQYEIDEMMKEGLLTFENTLFSKPETEFFNYILNNSEFDNALALRNKYLHGSVVEGDYRDYLYILIVLIVYVIKINDELIIDENVRDTESDNAVESELKNDQKGEK